MQEVVGADVYDEFIEKMKDVPETELNYYGGAICGGLSFPQAGLTAETLGKLGNQS